MKKEYKIKIDWLNLLPSISAAVSLMILLFFSEKNNYSGFIFFPVIAFWGLSIFSIITIFKYRIVVDSLAERIEERAVMSTLSLAIKEIDKIYYEVITSSRGSFLPGITNSVVVEFVVGSRFIKRRWFIEEAEFLEIMKDFLKINKNIKITTEYPDSTLTGIGHGESLNKNLFGKNIDTKYFPILIFFGLFLLFAIFTFLRNL